MAREEAEPQVEEFAARQRRPDALSFSQGGFKRHCQSRSEPRSWPYWTIASYVVMPASMATMAKEGKDGKGCFLPLAARGWRRPRPSGQTTGFLHKIG
jgi:hypothetical protein